MTTKSKVVVGMSGGVDSSVAALTLVQAGYDVTGMMLRLWSEEGKEGLNKCCTPDSVASARRVSAILGIPFYVIDIREKFHKEIVNYFIDGYREGVTPNPCIRCNQVIRWGALLEEATAFGAEYLATGHYARLEKDNQNTLKLRKGIDAGKDQSYVLSGLSQEKLRQTLLPIGGFQKDHVRGMARENKLPTAEKNDSQDLCFLSGDDYRNFLYRNSPKILISGPIKNLEGVVIGEHSGLANYTIGQRKGLGAFLKPYYVVGKEIETNTIIVGEKEALGMDTMCVENVNWISGHPPVLPDKIDVKIRYRAPTEKAMVSISENGGLWVKFDRKLRDITPGQQTAFYSGDYCLGGGIITRVMNA